MLVKARKRKVVSVVEDILCNKCGNSCRNVAMSDDKRSYFDFTVLKFETGSYASRFDDVQPVPRVHLCDDCCVELLLSLKIQPQFGAGTPQEIWGSTQPEQEQ